MFCKCRSAFIQCLSMPIIVPDGSLATSPPPKHQVGTFLCRGAAAQRHAWQLGAGVHCSHMVVASPRAGATGLSRSHHGHFPVMRQHCDMPERPLLHAYMHLSWSGRGRSLSDPAGPHTSAATALDAFIVESGEGREVHFAGFKNDALSGIRLYLDRRGTSTMPPRPPLQAHMKGNACLPRPPSLANRYHALPVYSHTHSLIACVMHAAAAG